MTAKPFNDYYSLTGALSKLPIEVSQRFALAAAREVAPDLQTVVILNVVEDYLDGKASKHTLQKAKDNIQESDASIYNEYCYAAAAYVGGLYNNSFRSLAYVIAANYSASAVSWERLNELLEEVKVEYERKNKVVT